MTSAPGAANPAIDARSTAYLRAERLLEIPVFLAALLVIPAIAIEQAEPGWPWTLVAVILNWVSWSVFLIEALVLSHLSGDRRAWVRTNKLDTAIVVLTVPALPALISFLRLVRLARLLRVLRLLRLVRSIEIGRKLFTPSGLAWASFWAALLIVAAGEAFVWVEGNNLDLSAWDGLYWAITTATTVGYGDVPVTTPEGRFLAILVMVVGIGLLALITGAVAERFLTTAQPPAEAAERAAEAHAERQQLLEHLVRVEARLERLERALGRLQLVPDPEDVPDDEPPRDTARLEEGGRAETYRRRRFRGR